MKRSIVLLTAVVGFAGCGLLEPGITRERQPARIRFYDDPALLDAPDTVTVGVPFTVTVRSFGGGCIDQGDTKVETTGMLVQLRPFDVFTTSMPKNYACTDELRYYAHTAPVQIDQPGIATIRAIGRVHPGDTATTIERQVVVR